MSKTITQNRAHDDAPVTTAKEAKGEHSLFAEAVTINRPAQELYDYWREQTNLAHFMENVENIDRIDDRTTHWRVKAPMDKIVEWDAVITDDQPGQSISWQSAEGADVVNSGKVEFKDAGRRGTVVRAVIAYEPPGGIIGQLVAKIFQREPRIQTRRDLNRFKQLMETGEIATAAWNRNMLEKDKE